MKTRSSKEYGPKQITSIIVRGSLYVAISLAALLVIYDAINGSLLRFRFWIACFVILYLLFIQFLIKRNRISSANWLLISLYEGLALAVLLYWGLGSVIGLVTACFVVLLPSVLMAPRSIAPVACITFGALVLTYIIHATKIITPTIYGIEIKTSLLDLFAYGTILAVFALVSWVSARQTSLSLTRALNAEEDLRRQKDSLAVELEQESSRLRQAQLQQIQQLYRFAVIGQSATATLHELSNHLSVLNLDIDDIKQQHQYSKAIANAKDGMAAINYMVRKAREQLNSEDSSTPFNAIPVIRRVVKDNSSKFQQHQVKLSLTIPKGLRSYSLVGNSMSLMQCISILLNNSLDACKDKPTSQVNLSLQVSGKALAITVSDTGPGIDKIQQKTLFQPLESTKQSGLGVGLYITKHLIESQFNGKLEYIPSKIGATFHITLSKPS